jgi:CelD/BcsL family acetyltransferase involved in cellulose biosynthesis
MKVAAEAERRDAPRPESQGAAGIALEVGREAFGQRERFWRALERDGATTPFQTWDWARAWLEHLAPDAEPWLLVRDGTAPLLLPLALRRRGPLRSLVLLGHGPSDYLGPLPAALTDGDARALAEALRRQRGGFDWMDLRGWHSTDDARRGFLEALRGRAVSRLYEPCPIVETTGTWDDYLASRTKKFRANLKRTARRVASLGTCTVAREPVDAALFDELVAVERESWKWTVGSAFLQDDARRRFLAAILLESSLDRELWTLRIEDELAAFALVFPSEGVRHYYLPSFRSRFTDVGAQLLRTIIEDSFAGRTEVFDFLQGDEAYKKPWTTGARSVHEIAASGRAWVGGPVVRGIEARWRLARSERIRRLRQRAMERWARMRGASRG